MKESSRYVKLVKWSNEDKCFIGTCPGLMLGGVHGSNEFKVYKELCQAVEEVMALYKESGRPLPEPTADKHFSGKFVLRVPSDLHEALYLKALEENESLNSVCESALNLYLAKT